MLAAIFGDELATRTNYAVVDAGRQQEMAGFIVRTMRETHPDASPLQLARLVMRGLLSAPQVNAGFAGHCEVAQRLAERMGFGERIIRALGQLYERWDGRARPCRSTAAKASSST